jgi:hypothetical protein
VQKSKIKILPIIVALLLGLSALVSFKEIKHVSKEKDDSKKESRVIEHLIFNQSNSSVHVLAPIHPTSDWNQSEFTFSVFELKFPFQIYLQKTTFKLFTLNFFKTLLTQTMSPQAP